MLAGAGGLGCVPPPRYVLPERGQQRLPEPPGTIAAASCEKGCWKWLRQGESLLAVEGELSFPLLWKTKQALSPFLEELAPCPLCSDPATPSSPASTRAGVRLGGGRRQRGFLHRPAQRLQAVNATPRVLGAASPTPPFPHAAGRAEGRGCPCLGTRFGGHESTPGSVVAARARCGCCPPQSVSCRSLGHEGSAKAARGAWLGLGREARVALAAARLRAGLVCSRVFGFAGLFF